MRELFKFDVNACDPAPDCVPSPQPTRTAPSRSRASPLEELAKCDAPHGSLLQQLSRPSQMSLVARYLALEPMACDAFEERAAILEHDAGLSRQEAEAEAFRMVMEAYRNAE